MGKNLGKSVLCFAGLAIVSWLLLSLDESILAWETSGAASLLVSTLLPYAYWFLLTVAYAFVLFCVFIKEKRCCLIVTLNGLFVFVLFFVLLLARVPSDIFIIMERMMQAGSVAVMVMALIFKMLISDKRQQVAEKAPDQAANVIRIILETIVGFGLFAILTFETYALTRNTPATILLPFLSMRFVWLMAAIIYASALYLFFRRQYHTVLIMTVNAALLAAIWCMILFPDTLSSMSALFPELKLFLCSLAGNTAILTVVLALVYKLAERIYAAHKAALRRDFDQHKADHIRPAM